MDQPPAPRSPDHLAGLAIRFDADAADADGLARDLAEWFNDDEDLGGLARLVMDPAKPGEMGALAEAVELITAAESLLTMGTGAFGLWLAQRVKNRQISFQVTRADGTRMHATADRKDLGEVVARMEQFVTDTDPAQAASDREGGGGHGDPTGSGMTEGAS
ncbi:hypothetical protein [Streptomyces sp. NPDC006879]|uniref:effector-associated constant component EACC1 n=1 Tax=Streptomyces sp. NPDC006879 TaxID=3364767 RepID=UPI003698C6C6